MVEPILKIDSVSKRYKDNILFENLSLNVGKGEILGIIGASGSGKTTLLHSVIGFITPDEGEIKFQEPNLLASQEKTAYKNIEQDKGELRKMYGFASQVPSFYEKLTVTENLYYFGRLYGVSSKTLDANVESLLKLLELENAKDILGKNLSGGMERRLDIACSLIHNPEILILDEPTADLDPVLRRNIWKLIHKINDNGTTILIASHHLNELETLCDRIAILKNASIIGIGSYEELSQKFTKGFQISIQSYPGEYEKLKDIIKEQMSKKIESITYNERELTIMSEDASNVMDEVMEIVKEKEDLIDIRLSKPNLDQIFIELSEEE